VTSAGEANRTNSSTRKPRLRAHKGRSRACQWQRPRAPALQCACASHGGVRGRMVKVRVPRGAVPGPARPVDVPDAPTMTRAPPPAGRAGAVLAGCPVTVTAPATRTVRRGRSHSGCDPESLAVTSWRTRSANRGNLTRLSQADSESVPRCFDPRFPWRRAPGDGDDCEPEGPVVAYTAPQAPPGPEQRSNMHEAAASHYDGFARLPT
jgi:hypothetical protein